jgi:hypothetical protein
MKKIQTLLSGLAFLVTAAVVTAHAEEAAAETNAGLAKLLDFRVAIALFVVVGICLLVSLVIWRMPRSKAKGEKDSEGQEVSDKDLEALRISYGFWLVVGALLITLLVLVITLSALAPAAPKTTDIVAIIGAVTGVIGTLTAAFFGIQAAGAGRSQALTTLDNTLKNQAAVSAPTPTKLDPSYGPHAGSTRVSITGNGFTGASGVNFGVTPGTNFEFVNDGLVRASSPAAGDGATKRSHAHLSRRNASEPRGWNILLLYDRASSRRWRTARDYQRFGPEGREGGPVRAKGCDSDRRPEAKSTYGDGARPPRRG